MNAPDLLAQLAAFARAVEPTLDEKSYYELLNLPASASMLDVRQAFYRVAAQLHPDRYVHLADREAKDKLNTIYARITEGYRVLSDPAKRREYDALLQRGQKRLVNTQRERKGPRAPEESLGKPEAKRFFRLGMTALDGRDFKGATLNFNLALAYEPDSQLIQQKLAQARAALAEQQAAAAAAKAAAAKGKPGS